MWLISKVLYLLAFLFSFVSVKKRNKKGNFLDSNLLNRLKVGIIYLVRAAINKDRWQKRGSELKIKVLHQGMYKYCP